jgi:hypothetical protein
MVQHYFSALLLASIACSASAQSDPALDARRMELDERYTVGPSAASELGYRIAWQSVVDEQEGELVRVDVIGNDVYAIAPRNRLTRLTRDTGKPIWTSTVADELDTVWGVTPGAPGSDGEFDRLYITTDPVVMEVDHATGAVVGRQDLERIPSTDVLQYDNFLVFGTHSGQVVWHQYLVGHAWRASQLLGPVTGTPIVVDGGDIAVGSLGGTVLVVDSRSARRIWGKRLFDAVPTALAAGGGFVVAAGRDQYVWAFDAGRGYLKWKYFTESPLTTSPTILGENVLQWVPTKGLVCLELDPRDEIEGRVKWMIEDASGDVVGTIKGDAVLFDTETRMLRIVDMAHGAIRTSIHLPKVRSLQFKGNEIYATGDGSHIQRLDPIR